MAKDSVHASPGNVKRLASALSTYQKDVATAAGKVQGALSTANWHDGRTSSKPATRTCRRASTTSCPARSRTWSSHSTS